MTYPSTTLTLQKNKYYVVCTIPTELRPAFNNRKQLKRSTGTNDLTIANKLEHDISAGIFKEFDEASVTISIKEPSKSVVLMEKLLNIIEQRDNGVAKGANLDDPVMSEELLFQFRQEIMKKKWSGSDDQNYKNQLVIDALVQDISDINKEKMGTETVTFTKASKKFVEDKNWTRQQTKKVNELSHKRFIEVFGKIDVRKIIKQHAYIFAKSLEKDGKANKTIKNHVSFVSNVLTYCEKEGYIEGNPFVKLKLADYGPKAESWKKFDDQQLTDIFSQSLPKDVDLFLSILLTTGMRLDEAAQLTYENIKTTDGIKHFDLTSNDMTLKNQGSRRLVPIVPELSKKLSSGKGKLFEKYKINSDGKSADAASRDLMPWINNITTDERQVVHSLRGTFKDLLRDAGVSKEINDFITGHKAGDAAGRYGSGPSLRARSEAMKKVDFKWL